MSLLNEPMKREISDKPGAGNSCLWWNKPHQENFFMKKKIHSQKVYVTIEIDMSFYIKNELLPNFQRKIKLMGNAFQWFCVIEL